MKMNNDKIINQTKNWLETVVVGFNFCPFAKKEVLKNSIAYYVAPFSEFENVFWKAIDELDENSAVETTLLIFPELTDFESFLDVDFICNQWLEQNNYSGVYQIATFHPDYCFQDCSPDDASNYTNRSPYPMLHLLRESSLEKAIEAYENAEQIPERNIEYARNLGTQKLSAILQNCIQKD